MYCFLKGLYRFDLILMLIYVYIYIFFSECPSFR